MIAFSIILALCAAFGGTIVLALCMAAGRADRFNLGPAEADATVKPTRSVCNSERV